MRLGLGLGPGVAGSSAASASTLLAIDFTLATLGNAGTLSSSFAGLTLARASAATVQTSASAVDSTPTTDQARIGSLGAAWGRGLVVEEGRTNYIFNNRNPTAAGWAAGANVTTTVAFANGPDGSANACRHQIASNGFARSGGAAPGAVQTVASMWVQATSANSPYYMRWASGADANRLQNGTATSAWTIVSTGNVLSAASGFLYPSDVTDAAGSADDILTDLHQVEVGQWRSEAIVTPGTASATRAGDHLSITTQVVDSNRFGLELTFVAKGTPAQLVASGNAFVWWIDANNNAFIDTSLKLNVKLGGTPVTSASAVAWAFGDVVGLWAACGAGSNAVVEYRLNGGAKTVLLNTALAGNPVQASTIDVLCSGTTNQLSCWLQRLTAYKTGQQPAWA